MSESVRALAALAQEYRLQAFRLLVKAGPDGLAAGELARSLGIAPPALSFHVGQLFNAGLVTSRREGRRIIYMADFTKMRHLLAYLTEDCCGGRPEICAGLAAPEWVAKRKQLETG